MPYHVVVKWNEKEVAPQLPDAFGEFPSFLVEETVGDDEQGTHWHFWVGCDWKMDKVRRAIDKVRTSKSKGVSVRKWDENLVYFCKGSTPILEPPENPDFLPCKVLHNSVPDMTDSKIWGFHLHYNSDKEVRKVYASQEKPPKLLDLLVDKVKGEDYTPEQVAQLLVDLIVDRGGEKMACNKMIGQAYIRTAMLFSNDFAIYRAKLLKFYLRDLYV